MGREPPGAGPGVIRGRDWPRVRGRVSPASGEKKTGDFTKSIFQRGKNGYPLPGHKRAILVGLL
jgi:hypothetical protein